MAPNILSKLTSTINLLEVPFKSGRHKVEESIVLRILVQLLVIIGIIAQDIAAQSLISLWAVPLSIIGAVWAWHTRHKRNITLKFFLSFGMIIALIAFLNNLTAEEAYDTRVLLAQLLINLQILHSFDLPRRQDLGYSIIIGFILLGVSGSISQTSAFGIAVVLFLMVSLPVLVYDYRSRLGLDDGLTQLTNSKSVKTTRIKFHLSYLTKLFFIITILGLSIFLILPRFPGYQIRAFPVSGPSGIEDQQFRRNQGGIVNPGYVRPGDDQGIGGGNRQNSNKFDSTFYYGFNTKINQNLRGELIPKIVMRVRSQAKGFWRVMAFDKYNGQGWEVTRSGQMKIDRSIWNYRFFLPTLITKAKTKEVIQSYTVVSELPDLIPALYSASELYFPTKQVGVDAEGALRSPVLLPEGLTYTVISQVPYRSKTELSKAPQKYSPIIQQHYLALSPNISDQIRQETERILATSPNPLVDPYNKAEYLTQYLKQHYSIPHELLGFPVLKPNEDLVYTFLFKTKGGYPDHFSTTLTVMLRSIGIPARLVVGFAPGQFNIFTGYYVVKNIDAYAMTEIYIPNYGWFAFDPIPGHPIIPPSIEEDETFSALKTFWNWIAGFLPSPVKGWIDGIIDLLFNTIGYILSKWIGSLFSEGWQGWLTGILTLVGVGFIGWISWNLVRTIRYQIWIAKLSPVERLYQDLLVTLSLWGWTKHRAQTPFEFVAYLSQQNLSPLTLETIAEISRAYVDWRYGNNVPSKDYLQNLINQLTLLKRQRNLSFLAKFLNK